MNVRYFSVARLKAFNRSGQNEAEQVLCPPFVTRPAHWTCVLRMMLTTMTLYLDSGIQKLGRFCVNFS